MVNFSILLSLASYGCLAYGGIVAFKVYFEYKKDNKGGK